MLNVPEQHVRKRLQCRSDVPGQWQLCHDVLNKQPVRQRRVQLQQHPPGARRCLPNQVHAYYMHRRRRAILSIKIKRRLSTGNRLRVVQHLALPSAL